MRYPRWTSAMCLLIPFLNGGCAVGLLLSDIPTTKDVSHKPENQREIAIGDVFELRRGAYLRSGDIPWIDTPHLYGVWALQEAEEQYGDARLAPMDVVFPRGELLVVNNGNPLLIPVEERAPSEGMPEGILDVIPAGTRFRVTRLLYRSKGGNGSLYYLGELLNGDRNGEEIRVDGLTNLGFYGYDAAGTGYGPNPFMIEKVTHADGTPATRPATEPVP